MNEQIPLEIEEKKSGRITPTHETAPRPLRLDFDIHTSGKRQRLQRIDRLARGVEDINQTLVRTTFKLLSRFLVDVGRAQYRVDLTTCG